MRVTKNIIKLLGATFLCVLLLSCSGECKHDFGEWVTVTEPTCSVEGLRARVCKECSAEQTEKMEMLEHTFTYTVDTANSCTGGGKRTGICDFCNETVVEQLEACEYDIKEIYDSALKYVCEITTYDRDGKGLALGTGVVYSAGGKILTNYHVIEGAYSVKVKLGGLEYSIVRVVMYNKDKDLAVISIDARTPTHATLCSLPLDVGSTVYAMGSPRGMTNTITKGAVTYSERELDGVKYVQHDASITNGNSGGPLFNSYGEVVGINTMTVRDSQNLNFAVSVGELDSGMKAANKTMAEFFAFNNDNYNKVTAAIMSDADHKIASEYQISIEENNILFMIIYDSSPNTIELFWSVESNDTETIFSLIIDKQEKVKYDFNVMGESRGYWLKGEMTASKIKKNMTPTGYTTNIPIGNRVKFLEFCSEAIEISLNIFEDYLQGAKVGVELRDIGFVAY